MLQIKNIIKDKDNVIFEIHKTLFRKTTVIKYTMLLTDYEEIIQELIMPQLEKDIIINILTAQLIII